MEKILVILALFCANLAPVFNAATDLTCYDCDPSDASCVNPSPSTEGGSHAVEYVCNLDNSVSRSSFKKTLEKVEKTEIQSKGAAQGLVYECYSVYVISTKPNDNVGKPDPGPGVYRGCLLKEATTANSCDELRDIFANQKNITTCRSCDINKCNTDNVGGGAPISVTASVAVLVINAVVCLYAISG